MTRAVACTTPATWSVIVLYQTPDGYVHESKHEDGSWTGGGSSSPVCRAALSSPLAAVSYVYKGKKEVRVYYLDDQYILQEACYSEDKGSWYSGGVGSLQIPTASNTSIAAIYFTDDQGGVHIRVYCQESSSNSIREVVHDNGSWSRGSSLATALGGSSLAAVTYSYNGLQIRLYYQGTDLNIKEHCYDGGRGWFAGGLNQGSVPRYAPISAIGWNYSGGVQIQVYWLNNQNAIVRTKNTGSWGPVTTVVGGLQPGTKFACAQWNDGSNLRVYCQVEDHVREVCCDDGNNWVDGTSLY